MKAKGTSLGRLVCKFQSENHIHPNNKILKYRLVNPTRSTVTSPLSSAFNMPVLLDPIEISFYGSFLVQLTSLRFYIKF